MARDDMPRRQYMKWAGVASTGALGAMAGCTGGDGGSTPTPRVVRETVVRERTVVKERTAAPQELTSLRILDPEGSITSPIFLYGIENGTWRQYGIDLNFEAAPFGKFTRQVAEDIAQVGGHSVLYAIQFMNDGADPMTSINQYQNFYNQIVTKSSSSIEDVADLEDAHIGIPFETSFTTKVVRAMIMDEYDFDILNDVAEMTSSPPVSIYNLLLDDEIDAALLFSALTLSANTRDDLQTIFNPLPFWEDRTGYAPSVGDNVTKIGWLGDNASVAQGFLEGWWDAVELFTEETDQAITQYGRIAGLTSDAQVQQAKDWIQRGWISPLERGYSQDRADATHELMQLLVDYDQLESIPDDTDALFTTTDALAEMAG